MNQATNGGGDQRSPAAKVETARREEQIVALRLRRVSYNKIARALGISKVSAIRAFDRAIRRTTKANIGEYHRVELAELEAEQASIWETIDAGKERKDAWRIKMAGLSMLNRIHIRRAKLLGLDAPTRIDLRGLYGDDDTLSAERLNRQRLLESFSIEDQIRIYEGLDKAEQLLIETTATQVPNGPHANGIVSADTDAETDSDTDEE